MNFVAVKPEVQHGFKRMMRFLFLQVALLVGLLVVVLGVGKPELAFSGSLPVLPVVSLVYQQQDMIRAGWSPEGLFAQIRPRFGEGEYRMAVRVMQDGGRKFPRIRELRGAAKFHPHQYVTFPLKLLIGPLQGSVLKALFSEDLIESGALRHQVVYRWETLPLLKEAFLKEGVALPQVARYNRLRLDGRALRQGQVLYFPWNWMRDDLELRPLSVKPPLYLMADLLGIRYAGYRLEPGESLYSGVVRRFVREGSHEETTRIANDLLALNGFADARILNPGQEIRIPLTWLREEFLHPVPSIHRLPRPPQPVEDVSRKLTKEDPCSNLLYVSSELCQSPLLSILTSPRG